MSRNTYTQRSSEAPMDFEYTSRPNVKPVWASDTTTPRKRPQITTSVPDDPFAPRTPRFGAAQNVPFIFQQPPPPREGTPAWAPPSNFSPVKAFPVAEIQDVDMPDATPPKPPSAADPPEDAGETRAVALGGMRRIFRTRNRGRRDVVRWKRDEGGDENDSEDDEGEETRLRPIKQTTSHHYTLNIPSASPPQSETPALLLGYLQFFFNLSLILVFLYLLIQFILTVQRDVEQRISEYSLDIVQEISTCAVQYRTNLCATNPIPAMAHQCASWETCMNRDPTKVGRAKVGAELIAEVVNGFVEPISWKTLVFTLSSLTFLTLFINTLLSLYRSRLTPPPPTPVVAPGVPPPSFPLVPPSTPFGAHHRYLSPTPAPGWRWHPEEDEEPGTPSRRRRLESGVEKIR